MSRRQQWISASILRAIYNDIKANDKKAVLHIVLSFFAIFRLHLARFEPVLFRSLRKEIWQLNEDNYRDSFDSGAEEGGLEPVGDLGYSGSVFLPFPPNLPRIPAAQFQTMRS